MIITLYYAFTSLSTVGFGDFHPKSDHERIFCSAILLFGVMIFSYIMGVFIEMIDTVKMRSQDLGDEDQLSKFFVFLTKFNYGKRVDQKL
jgi:hyperpolarization activated cyclic nucleotide-gated potassium channel 1